MTDRTCLDVAVTAEAEALAAGEGDPWKITKAGQDAIHPALAHLTPDYVRTLLDALADDRHQIEFRDDGWTIAHPLRERLNGSLFDCRFHWDDDDPDVRGRFYFDGDEIGEEVLSP